jgi:two-component system, NtrC family, response regulator GlrR
MAAQFTVWESDAGSALGRRASAVLARIAASDPALLGIGGGLRLVLAHPGCLDAAAAQVACAVPQSVIVVSSRLSPSQLAALLDEGARDFVCDPFGDDELELRVRRACRQIASLEPAPPLPKALHPNIRGFVGSSPAFMRQVEKLPTFAGCDANVLILGETGTGKEIFARAIHYCSARASRPWVAVNCGAMPTELVENELFGHIRGAYTTAHGERAGLVREAEGGTLFLDDVDCLPQAAQAKLLRFLQEGEFRPVGSNTVWRANVRVVAASNQRLPELVAGGGFRQDLFFRLNVLTLQLPPLRERRDDIAALALHFVREFAAQFKRVPPAPSARALQKLVLHGWPGNVRELRHVIERAVLLAPGPVLGAEDIDIDGGSEAPPLDADSFRAAKARLVENFERHFIETLLAEHGGNVTHAALAAQKNRRAFFELMRKHRIEPERFRALDH